LSTSFQMRGSQSGRSGKTGPHNWTLATATNTAHDATLSHCQPAIRRFSKSPAPPHQKCPSNEIDDPETETSAAHDQYPADAISSPADHAHARPAPQH